MQKYKHTNSELYLKNPGEKIKFHSRKTARDNKQSFSTQEEKERSTNTRKQVKSSAFVCSGCCKESPQAWVLKTTKNDSLIVLESRNLKSVSLGRHHGAGRAMLPLEAQGENPSPASSSVYGLQQSSVSGFVATLPLYRVSKLPLPLLSKHPRDGIGGPLNNPG